MIERIKALAQKRHHQTVFHALGMKIDKLDPDETIISLAIDDRHLQHVGLVHGGIYVLLAESAASLAAACTLVDEQSSVVALEINANHIRSTSSGVLYARSHCLHRGKRTLVYEVKVVDQDKHLISMARCTLMVTLLKKRELVLSEA